MNRPLVNFTLDAIALLLFATLAATGLLIGFTLPAGSGGATVLGLTRHDWGDIHLWVSIAFLIAMVIHLLLHAKWILALAVGRANGVTRLGRTAALVAVLVVCLAAMAAALVMPVSPGDSGRGREAAQVDETRHQNVNHGQRGQMRGEGRRARPTD